MKNPLQIEFESSDSDSWVFSCPYCDEERSITRNTSRTKIRCRSCRSLFDLPRQESQGYFYEDITIDKERSKPKKMEVKSTRNRIKEYNGTHEDKAQVKLAVWCFVCGIFTLFFTMLSIGPSIALDTRKTFNGIAFIFLLVTVHKGIKYFDDSRKLSLLVIFGLLLADTPSIFLIHQNMLFFLGLLFFARLMLYAFAVLSKMDIQVKKQKLMRLKIVGYVFAITFALNFSIILATIRAVKGP